MREWYLRAAVEYGWSRNVLVHQITSRLHEREGKALTNFQRALPPPDSDLAEQILKDPYNFDFLTVAPAAREREIERGLLMHLRDLLLELGRGFAFVGSQVMLEVGDPARKVKVPSQLRDTDKTILTWNQLRMALSELSVRDRLLLELDMTNALRPSELFGLRWKSFNQAASTMCVTETVYKGNIRPWGKTRRSLAAVHLPKDLVAKLAEWKQQSPDSSPDAFIFPNQDGGFLDTDNYRKRVLHKLARNLELPKLTFQVIRRTIATLAQKKGTVKDVQGVLRHSRAATTTDVYMQEIPASVQATVNSIHRELRAKVGSSVRAGKRSLPRPQTHTAEQPKGGGAAGEIRAKKAIPGSPKNGSKPEQSAPVSEKGFLNLLPNATKPEKGDSVSY